MSIKWIVEKVVRMMVKLQYDSNKQFKITLPKQILLAKGWKKGDNLKIELDADGNLVLKRQNDAKIVQGKNYSKIRQKWLLKNIKKTAEKEIMEKSW